MEIALTNPTYPLADPHLWLGLFYGLPTDPELGYEVESATYRRALVTVVNTIPTASLRVYNESPITFPLPNEVWGDVSHIGFFDRPADGLLVGYGSLDRSNFIYRGDSILIPKTDLDMAVVYDATMDEGLGGYKLMLADGSATATLAVYRSQYRGDGVVYPNENADAGLIVALQEGRYLTTLDGLFIAVGDNGVLALE